jgi:hypothetical protein
MTTTAENPNPAGVGAPGRARIAARTLRTDRWWVQPLLTVTILVAFIIYSTYRAFANKYYYASPYHSPFYSPCLATTCEGPSIKIFPGNAFFTPAIFILIFPLGFRLTCYYYRKAYYRSFWMSPPACAVAEPHKSYSGETKVPLIGNNIHRYFFYAGMVFNVILTYDAIVSYWFKTPDGGHSVGIGLGSLILTLNATLLWLYTLSCHSCRHIMGGRLTHFSKHPLRYKGWTFVSKLNHKHMQLAWVSLFGVALTDVYVMLVSSGVFSDPRVIF